LRKNRFFPRRSALITLWAVLFIASVPGLAQIRFRPRPYLGFGWRRILAGKDPEIELTDDFDRLYFERNIEAARKGFFAVQVRLNLLQVGPVTAGYLFWSHHYDYSDQTLNNLVKVETDYPHSYNLTMHGIGLQLDLKFRGFYTRRFHVFLLGGGGKFFGNFNEYRYTGTDFIGEEPQQYEKIVSESEAYSGWGYFAGVGAVIFRHAYVYVGIVDLMKEYLPARQYVEAVVGVTL
jgi:hypothetical protein